MKSYQGHPKKNPDLVTNSGPLLALRSESGIPDLIGPTAPQKNSKYPSNFNHPEFLTLLLDETDLQIVKRGIQRIVHFAVN